MERIVEARRPEEVVVREGMARTMIEASESRGGFEDGFREG